MQRNVELLLAQLQASEHDKFVAHLYQARKQYRLVCGRQTRRLNAKSFQDTRWRRAWDSTVTFARGSTCCGFTNNKGAQNMQIAASRLTDHFSGRAATAAAPSQSTHCTSLHVLFLPRSPSLPARTLAWPTVTEGRLRCFGRGCRCRCSTAQHRQRHCSYESDP